MGVVLVLACWVSAMLFFFGSKLMELYGVLLSLFTHFLPLGPIALVVAIVALIVAIAPKRALEG